MNQSDSDEWRALREPRKAADEEWAVARERFTSGVVVTGVVLSHHAFGFFVDLGGPVTGLVEIPRVKESVTVTGLVNGTTYYFKVAAVNRVGEGAAPASASAIPTG